MASDPIKLSELTAAAQANGDDIVHVSVPDGQGGYVTRSLTTQQIADLASGWEIGDIGIFPESKTMPGWLDLDGSQYLISNYQSLVDFYEEWGIGLAYSGTVWSDQKSEVYDIDLREIYFSAGGSYVYAIDNSGVIRSYSTFDGSFVASNDTGEGFSRPIQYAFGHLFYFRASSTEIVKLDGNTLVELGATSIQNYSSIFQMGAGNAGGKNYLVVPDSGSPTDSKCSVINVDTMSLDYVVYSIPEYCSSVKVHGGVAIFGSQSAPATLVNLEDGSKTTGVDTYSSDGQPWSVNIDEYRLYFIHRNDANVYVADRETGDLLYTIPLTLDDFIKDSYVVGDILLMVGYDYGDVIRVYPSAGTEGELKSTGMTCSDLSCVNSSVYALYDNSTIERYSVSADYFSTPQNSTGISGSVYRVKAE